MPIYEYECPTHGRFEVQQRITEDALKVCTSPTCQQPVRKLISNTSFALKGGGWYSDLYSSTGKPSGGKSEAKADSTPAATTTSSDAGSGPGASGAVASAPKAQA